MNIKILRGLGAVLSGMLLLFSVSSCMGADPTASVTTDGPASEVDESVGRSVTSDIMAPTSDAVQAAAHTMGTPRSTVEWINLYNTAADGLQCTYSAQQLMAGEIRAGSIVSVDILSDGAQALRAKAEKTENGGSSLPHLSPTDVSTVQKEGAAVTFRLKDITLSAQEAEQGRDGYVNIIDRTRALAVIDGAKEYFHIANADVKLKSVTHTLTDGTLTVVFDSGLTRLESARFTAKQHARAVMSYLVTVEADLAYDLTSEYR